MVKYAQLTCFVLAVSVTVCMGMNLPGVPSVPGVPGGSGADKCQGEILLVTGKIQFVEGLVLDVGVYLYLKIDPCLLRNPLLKLLLLVPKGDTEVEVISVIDVGKGKIIPDGDFLKVLLKDPLTVTTRVLLGFYLEAGSVMTPFNRTSDVKIANVRIGNPFGRLWETVDTFLPESVKPGLIISILKAKYLLTICLHGSIEICLLPLDLGLPGLPAIPGLPSLPIPDPTCLDVTGALDKAGLLPIDLPLLK